jgi:hypothetical protein
MLDFAVLIQELVKSGARNRKNAFADPLEGQEWEGLHWMLRLFERRSAERSAEVRPGKQSDRILYTTSSQCSSVR